MRGELRRWRLRQLNYPRADRIGESMERVMTKVVRSVALHAAFLVAAACHADERESREASGLLNAVLANSVAMESFEVFVVLNESAITLDDSVIEASQEYLIAADNVGNRFSVLKRERRRLGDQRNGCVSSFVIASGKGSRLSCDGKVVSYDSPSQVLLAQFGIPDLRLIGHARFLTGHGLFDGLKSRYSSARDFRMRPLGGSKRGELQIELQVLRGPNKLEFQKVWHMDPEQLVPTLYRNRVHNPEKDLWITLSTEQISWADRDGFQVPESVIGERKKPGIRPDGIDEYFSVDFEATLDWISVNRVLPESKFQFGEFEDPGSVVKAIDAAKSKFARTKLK